ncbi:DALR domain-containing protein [Escherichia coli]
MDDDFNTPEAYCHVTV